MKIKYLVTACAALCATGAFAGTYSTTITPDTVVYIAGASAQKNALLATVPGSAFSTSTNGVLYITGPNGSVGWLGEDAQNAGKTLLVVYNSTNGSAAGLNQLISTGTTEAEAKVLSLPATCGTVNTTVPAGNNANAVVDCSTTTAVAREADMALSDVYAGEFAPGLLTTGNELQPAVTVNATTGLEGFGVIVNSVLYNALLAQNIADGILSSSCATATAATLTVGTGNGACQPSIRSADYAALVTNGGNNSYAAVVKGQASKNITVCRRDDLSGTQAASNIFFLNNVCGTQGYFGALAVTTSKNSKTGFTVLDSVNDGTGKAEACVYSGSATGTTAMTNYGIGVVSLGEKDAVDATPASGKPVFYFVKLDGVSPNYTAAGAYDKFHNSNLVTGSYKFATEMAAYAKASTDLSSGKGLIASTIANTIADASVSAAQTVGLGYLTDNGTPASVHDARYLKGGNNCAAWLPSGL
jgi:hypothetical protein